MTDDGSDPAFVWRAAITSAALLLERMGHNVVTNTRDIDAAIQEDIAEEVYIEAAEAVRKLAYSETRPVYKWVDDLIGRVQDGDAREALIRLSTELSVLKRENYEFVHAYHGMHSDFIRSENLLATQKAHLLQYEADLNTSKQTIDALKAEVERLKNRETELMMRLTYALNPGP